MRSDPKHLLSQRPAVEGGRPVRSAPIRPVVPVSAGARAEIEAVLRDGELSRWQGGPHAHRFEAAFAAYHGVPYAVAVNSGTSALHVAYVAAGLGPGDEVLIPSAGYVSAAIAAVQEGAIPIICDVDPETMTLNPSDVERRIGPQTRLIVPVHFWGRPTEMDEIMRLAERHKLAVVEDCGQSHGAAIGRRVVGSIGHMAAFSFAPRKHICTGQGGMVIAKDPTHARLALETANKGKGDGWLDYHRLGFSYVMPDVDAIIGLDGLARLDQEIQQRQRVAAVFVDVLADSGIELPKVDPPIRHVYFKIPLRLPRALTRFAGRMISALLAENILARPSHPPMHLINWVKDFCIRQAPAHPAVLLPRPVAEAEIPRFIEVESGPNLTDEEAEISAIGVLRVYRWIERLAAAKDQPTP